MGDARQRQRAGLSVNMKSGAVTHNAADVGAYAVTQIDAMLDPGLF